MDWLRALFSFLSGLLEAGKTALIFKAGKDSQRAADMEKNTEIKDAQIKAEQDHPADSADLAKRLRNDGL